jgi:hypothetical protein
MISILKLTHRVESTRGCKPFACEMMPMALSTMGPTLVFPIAEHPLSRVVQNAATAIAVEVKKSKSLCGLPAG